MKIKKNTLTQSLPPLWFQYWSETNKKINLNQLNPAQKLFNRYDTVADFSPLATILHKDRKTENLSLLAILNQISEVSLVYYEDRTKFKHTWDIWLDRDIHIIFHYYASWSFNHHLYRPTMTNSQHSRPSCTPGYSQAAWCVGFLSSWKHNPVHC